jgi:hypothetical protein
MSGQRIYTSLQDDLLCIKAQWCIQIKADGEREHRSKHVLCVGFASIGGASYRRQALQSSYAVGCEQARLTENRGIGSRLSSHCF